MCLCILQIMATSNEHLPGAVLDIHIKAVYCVFFIPFMSSIHSMNKLHTGLPNMSDCMSLQCTLRKILTFFFSKTTQLHGQTEHGYNLFYYI